MRHMFQHFKERLLITILLERFENLSDLEDWEHNFNEENVNEAGHGEWQEPTQADVRYMEEIRNAIRGQLPIGRRS